MGSKNINTDRAEQQRRLDELRNQITIWYIDEKLTSLDIQEKLLHHGLDLTVGQIHYAFHRFELIRPRNLMTKKHLNAIQCRVHSMKNCKHCKNVYKPGSGCQIFCAACAPTKSYVRRIRNYGVGKREFDMMLIKQNHVCAICSKCLNDDSAAVDHDHSTLKVRGLLCRPCNLKLSVIEDNDFVNHAQMYLSQHKEKT